MNNLTDSLTILSAMITPAVLILASGSLILTTSQRLGRVIERTRKLTGTLKELARDTTDDPLNAEERTVLYAQLNRAAKRAGFLQRAMTCLYLALSLFVSTSVAIAVFDLFDFAYTWVPLAFIAGISTLFYASLMLISESRIALAAVDEEMRFAVKISRFSAAEPKASRRITH
jgi:hypothetical protein